MDPVQDVHSSTDVPPHDHANSPEFLHVLHTSFRFPVTERDREVIFDLLRVQQLKFGDELTISHLKEAYFMAKGSELTKHMIDFYFDCYDLLQACKESFSDTFNVGRRNGVDILFVKKDFCPSSLTRRNWIVKDDGSWEMEPEPQFKIDLSMKCTKKVKGLKGYTSGGEGVYSDSE